MWISNEAYKHIVGRISELKEELIHRQDEIVESKKEFRESLTSQQLVFDSQMQKQRLHYENLLQQMAIQNRSLIDRLMLALGLPQVNNTAPIVRPATKDNEQSEWKEEISGSGLGPGARAVLMAIEQDQQEHKNRIQTMQEKAVEVVRQQRERDEAAEQNPLSMTVEELSAIEE